MVSAVQNRFTNAKYSLFAIEIKAAFLSRFLSAKFNFQLTAHTFSTLGFAKFFFCCGLPHYVII